MRKRIARDDAHCRYVEFGECGKVGTAMAQQFSSLHSDRWEAARVNWSCVGALYVKDAKRFHAILTAAIKEAERLNRTRAGKPVKRKGTQ